MKNMKRIVSLLMTLMLIFSSAVSSATVISSSAAIQVQTTASADNANLNNFLIGVKIIDKTTNQEVTGKLETGKSYKIRLDFKEGNREKQFQINSEGKMVYTFPKGLNISDLDGEYALLVGNMQIGTYTIKNNQLIFTPWYSSDKNSYHEGCKDPANEKTYADWAVNAEFWFDVTGIFTEEKKDFKFSDSLQKEWEIISPDKAPQTKLEKTATYDKDTKTLHYKLTATVTNSDADELKLSDILKDTTYVKGIQKDTLKIKKNGESYTLTENDVLSWKEKATESGNYTQGFDLTLKNVKKDDSYEIEYDVPIDEEKINAAQLGTTGSVTVGNNKFSGQADGGDKRDVEWNGTYFPGKKPVDKSNGTADKVDPTILNWQLTVGSPNETDETKKINGKTLTDTWRYDNNTITGVTLLDDSIIVTLYDFNGQTHILTGAEAKAYFTANTAGTGFTFKVPDLPGFNVKYCKVDYKTQCTMTEDATNNKQTGKVYNDAEFDGSHAGGEGTAGGQGEVYLPDMNLDKAVDDLGGVLHYTITVQVPKEYINNQGFYLEDKLNWTGSNGHFDFWIYNDPDSLKVTARDESGHEKTFERGAGDYHYCFVKGTGGNVGNAKFWLYFNATDESNPSGTYGPWKWETDENVTLTIEYDISKDERVADVNYNGWNYPDEYSKTIADLSYGTIHNYCKLTAKKTYEATADVDITRKVIKTAKLEGDDGTRVRYQVDLNKTGLTPIPVGATFTDVYDEHMELESIVAHIMWNNSGNDQIVTYTQCPSQTEADKAKHTISFTFGPFGSASGWQAGTVEIEHWLGQIWQPKLNGNNWISAKEQYQNDSEWYRHPYTEGGVTKYPWIRIEYVLKVKDEYINGQSLWVTNTAKISGWNEASTTTFLEPKIVDKTMEVDANNKMLLFTINVNPMGQMLNGGEQLTLNDSMTNLIPILDDALTVTDTKANQKLTRGADWQVTYDSATDKLTFTLPDGKPLKIQYHAVVRDANSNNNGTASISNTAELLGQRSEFDKGNFNVSDTSGGASSSEYSIYINKVAAGTYEALKDAKFHVTYYHSTNEGKTFTEYVFGDYVTDENGQIILSKGNHEHLGDNNLLYANTVYCIQETQAPTGYQTTNRKWYFYIENTKDDSNYITEALAWFQKQNITVERKLNNSVFVIENEPGQQTVDFSFLKTSEGGAPLSGAAFTLTEQGTTNVKRATSAANGGVSFSGLEPGKTYILEETQAPNGYMRSTQKWTITVNTDGSIAVTDENGAPVSLNNDVYVFINEQLPDLPSVGGSGTLAYSLFGLALMAMAAAAAYALAEKRRRIER